MKRYPLTLPAFGDESTGPRNRRGAFIVVAFFCLTACITFVAFSVDVGTISLTKTKMQNAVDAAALAAAMEITHAVENAGPDVSDLVEYSKTQAASKAVEVAALNGVYVDPTVDVEFGKRTYNGSTGKFEVTWNESPSNVVRVIARRDDPDVSKPDGQLQLFFAGVTGDRTATIRAEAVAYVEARDIVTVLDFSGSMTYDSQFRSETVDKLGISAIETNLEQIFSDLQPIDVGEMVSTPKYLTLDSPPGDAGDPSASVTFKYDEADVTSDAPYSEVVLEFTNGKTQKFSGLNESSGTYSGSGSNSGKDIETVWVKYITGEEVTIVGEPGSGCRPTIEVTFSPDMTSVDVVSSKDLSNVVLEFEDGSRYKFDNLNQGHTGTFQGNGSNAGKIIETVWVKSGCNSSGRRGYGERFDAPDSDSTLIAYRFDDTNDNVEAVFGLDDVSYPFASGSWNSYIEYVRDDSDINRGGYREMYGGMTFVHYLLDVKRRHYQTQDLWKTRHYPFHAIKEGHTLFADFLGDLGFGDHLGLVSYDTYHRLETILDEDDDDIPYVDISAEPLTSNYSDVATIMRHKQAAHYYDTTNIGGGISRGIAAIEAYGRPGARPTILLMTDGNANVTESYTTPSDWDWDALFDYNGDGSADYRLNGNESNYSAKMFALVKAKEAVDKDITIHTLSVGAGADRDLMRAIAHMANGHWIDVPGGSTIAEMEAEVLEAFNRIAAFVPPAKLLSGN